ncbi:MAG: SDR family oxidoreductase [Albidovulum sp.]|nr:SDR family oxidoreductase [Albidovulum sp.]MDE0307117.1 SDR family oxidoreductase [Albidovulum sp.]MDE0531021.1 SDR family oxidoreductase [Albidovulum sp.]
MKRTLLCFGVGYSARALSRLLLSTGEWRIIGSTRSPEKAASAKLLQIDSIIWPGGDLAPAIENATHLLMSIAPGDRGDPVIEAYGEEIISSASGICWAGYLSTTAVYGDRGGRWVDEESPLAPTTERGRRRVDAERAWQKLATKCGLPLHIFRLAGIYGPGRGPLEAVKTGRGRRIIKKNQVFNRIHVEDIAKALAASIEKPEPGEIYNLCDDLPAPPQEVVAFASELLGVPLPEAVPFESAEMTRMARSFYSESKKVSNEKLKRQLGLSLAYPDYLSGLSSLAGETPQPNAP